MTTQVNVAEAKAQLSKLLDAAAAGDDVVIARAGKPVARLVAIEAPPRRQLGFASLNLDLDDDMWLPLTGAELAEWE